MKTISSLPKSTIASSSDPQCHSVLLDWLNTDCLPFTQDNPDVSDGMYMESIILSPQTEILSGKWDFLIERYLDQNSQTDISNGKCALHLLQAFWLRLPLILSFISSGKKVMEMERVHPRENFHSGFSSSHLLRLSTNWFFRVNGKQPYFLESRWFYG